MEEKPVNNKFLAEIYEQPGALADTLDFYTGGEGKELLSRATGYRTAKNSTRIIFTGMGSSFFISHMASVILNSFGIPAQAINTGELIHYQLRVISQDTLIICISQSGESYEIKKLLEELSGHSACIAICNESGSTLVRKADVAMLSKAGIEHMTSTKTFVSTALVAIIYSLSVAGQWSSGRITAVKQIIDSVDRIIRGHSSWLPGVMGMMAGKNFIQLVGRGPSMAAVQQGALMFMEGARIPASALFSGEFRHGPMELVKEGFLAIILAPSGETYTQHMMLAEDIIHFGGRVIFVSNYESEDLSKEALFVHAPCADEIFFSIPSIIPLQFMVNQCAIEKGSIPGEFLRGSKITSRE